jgi:hypothetical protein
MGSGQLKHYLRNDPTCGNAFDDYFKSGGYSNIHVVTRNPRFPLRLTSQPEWVIEDGPCPVEYNDTSLAQN